MHHCINNPEPDFPSIIPYKIQAHIPDGLQINGTVMHCGLLGSGTTYETTQRHNPEVKISKIRQNNYYRRF
jgi:hypothetical protein